MAKLISKRKSNYLSKYFNVLKSRKVRNVTCCSGLKYVGHYPLRDIKKLTILAEVSCL